MGEIAERVGRSWTFRIVIGFLLASALLFATGWLVTGPYRWSIQPFDSAVRTGARAIESPLWTSLFLTVTKLGSTIYLIVIGCVVGVAFIALRWFRPLFLFVIAMAGQAALHHGFKYLIARPRPSALIPYRIDESFSFPSGHAVSSLCLYAAIAWFCSNRIENPAAKVGIWLSAAVLVLLIGLSRIYIGIHFPSDVLAGFTGATIWTAAVASLDRRDD